MSILHRQKGMYVSGRTHFIKEDCRDISVGINFAKKILIISIIFFVFLLF